MEITVIVCVLILWLYVFEADLIIGLILIILCYVWMPEEVAETPARPVVIPQVIPKEPITIHYRTKEIL